MRIESTPGFDPVAERARERYGDTIGRVVIRPRCHLYLRVSSPEQDRPRQRDGKRTRTSAAAQEREMLRSLDTQEQEARSHADRAGYDVVKVYRETFTSLEFWSRPKLADLRGAIAASEVDVMLCLKMERLGATSIQLAVLEDLLQRHGGRLEFVQHVFDDSAMGRIGKTVYAEFNTFRLENLREQFSRAKVARVQNGEPLHGSRPPYGCAWTDDDRTAYCWQEPEVTYVREVFERFDAGWSLARIARSLTARGIPAPGGGRVWLANTLSAVILRNPLYCGQPQSNRWISTRLAGATATGKRRRDSRRRPADHERPPQTLAMVMAGEPPVTPELFARVQEHLDANVAAAAALKEAKQTGASRPVDLREGASRGGRPVADPDAAVGVLLRGGYLRCKKCEGPLSIVKAGRYGCRANREGPLPDGSRRCMEPVTIDARRAEAVVWARLLTYSQSADAVESALLAYADARAAAKAGGADADAAAAASLRARLDEIEQKTQNLIGELALAGPVVKESIRRHLAGLERDAGAAREELARVETKLAAAGRVREDAIDQAEAVRRMGAWLADPAVAEDPRNRRRAVEMLSPITTVAPAAKMGLGADAEARLVTEWPPDAARYAALRAADGAPTQHGQTWSSRVTTTSSVRLVVAPGGGLRVA